MGAGERCSEGALPQALALALPGARGDGKAAAETVTVGGATAACAAKYISTPAGTRSNRRMSCSSEPLSGTRHAEGAGAGRAEEQGD